MTGKKYCPEPVRGACTACFNEALRKQYQAELEAEARYAKLAARAGEARVRSRRSPATRVGMQR